MKILFRISFKFTEIDTENFGKTLGYFELLRTNNYTYIYIVLYCVIIFKYIFIVILYF